MIVVRIMGGLGNQLFQYASSYSLAKRMNQELKLDASFFPKQNLRGLKLDKFNIEYADAISDLPFLTKVYKNRYLNKVLRDCNLSILPCGENTKYILETCSDIVPKFYTINEDNIYIDGYYQSEEYFKDYRKEIIRQFTPKYSFEKEYNDELNKIINCESVAIHVRRGDFLSVQNDHNPNHYLLSEQYYHNALKYVKEELNNPTFFWFSDDIDWVKKNFKESDNYHFVSLRTEHADIDEMMLMKNCKHIIAANSTFSWWASWLNEKSDALHICPKKRYGNLHMIPDNWIKIDVE